MSDQEIAKLAGLNDRNSRSPSELTSPDAIEHDFGVILASGQELRHDFEVSNPTTHVIKISKVMPLVPCCTAVEAFPASVLPGEVAKISVVFRPGLQTGARKASFDLQSEDLHGSFKSLVLSAKLYAEWEVADEAPFDRILILGKEGKQRFRVTSRRHGNRGRSLPSITKSTGELKGRFVGEIAQWEPIVGLVETSRSFEVNLPASSVLGSRQEAFDFRWDDGQVRPVDIAWTVEPGVRTNPPALTLRKDDPSSIREVLITSEDSPFRVTNVSGPWLAGPVPMPSTSSRSHRLKLVLDPSLAIGSIASDIQVTTDRSDQPRLTISVLMLPATGGSRR